MNAAVCGSDQRGHIYVGMLTKFHVFCFEMEPGFMGVIEHSHNRVHVHLHVHSCEQTHWRLPSMYVLVSIYLFVLRVFFSQGVPLSKHQLGIFIFSFLFIRFYLFLFLSSQADSRF